MPMQVVRLDTESSRKAAANGKFFQITTVPTMVIMYEDGNTQLFLGAPKIIQWLTAMIKSASAGARKEQQAPRQEQQNMYGPISDSYPRPRRQVIDEGEDMDATPIPIEEEDDLPPPPPQRRPAQRKAPVVVEEDYPEEEPEEEEPQEKPKSKKKSKAKSRRKPVVVEEDDSVAAKRRMAKDKLNKAASTKSKPLSSRMKDVYSVAKQMEADMKNSLGYKEEELPHY